MNRRTLLLPALTALLLSGSTLTAPVAAAPPAAAVSESPDAIVKRALSRDALGMAGGHAQITLKITGDDGAVESKSIELWAGKEDGLLRTKIIFRAPAKIAGMGFLLLGQKGGLDEQYVYLPAYKKSRRVTLAERTTAFAGTDLTYADLEHREIDDATYTRLSDETLDKDLCRVIDAKPTERAKSAYQHVKLWLRASDDVPMKTEWYDASGKLEKTMVAKKVATIDGRTLVTEAHIARAAGKHATDVIVDKVDFPASMPAGTFARTTFDAGG